MARWFALLMLGLAAADRVAPAAPGDELPLEAPPRQPLTPPPSIVTREVAELVEQLGDDAFLKRELATSKLAALGMAAKPGLVAALKHSDPEVRLRARRLLGEIQAADLEARLKAFVEDTQGRQEHDVPGWERFRKTIGDSESARKLFADMHRAEPALMETASTGGDVAGECLSMRAYQMLRNLQLGYSSGRAPTPISFPAAAATVFVAGDERAKVSDQTQQQVMNFIQQQSFQQALQTGGQVDLAKKLLGQWVARQTNMNTAQQAIYYAMQWDLKQGAIPARKFAADKGASPYIRATAMTALGKLGGKEDLPLLRDALSDTAMLNRRITVVDGKRTEMNTEMRDLALAVLVYMTGQKLEDYGYTNVRIDPRMFFNYGQIYFNTPEARDKAFKKWAEWAAKHPLDVAPQPAAEKPAKTAPAVPGARMGGIFIGGGVMVAAAVTKPADDKTVADELPFYVADREAGLRLTRARKMIEDKQYAQALRALDSILAQTEDRSFQPEAGQPLYQSLRIEAHRLLGGLPNEGRRAYELLVGSDARRELDEAVAAGDAIRLRSVARRYLPASAGQEAALLWGEHLLDAGQPLAAAAVFQALRDHDRQRRFEPMLSLRLAHCWLWAGMPGEARAALRHTNASRTDLDVQIAGRRLPPPDDVEGVLVALNQGAAVQLSPVPQPGDWALYRGDAQRNAAAGGQSPWLRSRWRVEMARTPTVRDAINTLSSAYRQERLSALPTTHPLALGDTVLARTTGELLALNTETGEVRWRVPLTDAVDELIRGPSGQPADNTALLRGVDERLWNDLTYGTLASDGRYAFLVEDVGLVAGLGAERMIVQPDGSRRLDAGWPGENNRLTAYDLRTGKFRWEIGGPRSAFQLELAGAYFLGPPLPVAGRLYVMAETESRICLLALDSRSGRLLSRTPLAAVDGPDHGLRNANIYMMAAPGRPSRRLSGASPSYAGGVMVCPTSWNSFTAVDAASGAILWSYRPLRLDQDARPNPNMWMFGMAQSRGAVHDALRRDDRWADCSATIAGDRVLITPRENDRLLCLDLHSGRLLWEAPRRESQYVAGVTGDVALLVGRSSVRGLRMTDGAPAWDALPLPAGGGPSGRGYVADGRCYLPLTSAEVAVIDPAAGRLLYRSKSADGRVPGNLVCGKQFVLSQGPDGIESFPRLETVLASAASTALQRPNDAAALAEYGRMLLSHGDYAEAIAQLRRSVEIGKDAAARSLLCDAVLQALDADFATHRAAAVELASAFKEANQESAYLRAMAVGLRRGGQLLEAFDALADLAGRENPNEQPEPAGAAHYARRDAWLRGQLTNLTTACTAADRTEIERRINERLTKAIAAKDMGAKDMAALRQGLEIYGVLGGNPRLVAEVREALLAPQIDATGKLLDPKVRPLTVERLLLETRMSATAEQSRAATARLAQVMLAQQRPEEAAALFRTLSTRHGQAICLAGKTGQQLFAELPADSPVRRVLEAPSAWPQGIVEKQTITGAAAQINQSAWPLNLEGSRNGLLEELRLEVTANAMPPRIIARDARGAERWNLELKTPEGISVGVGRQTLRAKIDGHLLFVWQGNRVFAIDTLGTAAARAEILWTKDLTSKFPGLGNNGYQQQVVFFAGGGVPVFAATDAQGRPVAEVGPVTSRRICYQSLRTLTAVDPLTGNTLWSRHDLPHACDLLGDDEVILAVPRDATTATVFRAADGQELGRCEVPDKRDRQAVIGRMVVTWSGGDERQTLRLLDPWGGRDVWTRDFPAGSKLSRLGTNEAGVDEAAILDLQGNFTLLALSDGRPAVSTRIKAPERLLDIQVLRGRDRYLLLAKQSLPAAAIGKPGDKPLEKMVYPLSSMGGQTELVSGTIYGFDRATGALRWESPVEQRGLDLSQAADSPVLVLAERTFYQGSLASRGFETRVTCLDKRDGRVLLDETGKQNTGVLQVVPDAANHAIELRTNGGTATKLVFTGKPRTPK